MTRFATWPAWRARLLLALVVAFVVLGSGRYQRPAVVYPVRHRDVNLYQDIAARVRSGEGYYAAALTEHRAHDAPTNPALAFREPTLAWIIAALGPATTRVVLIGAAAIIGALFWWALGLETTIWTLLAAALLQLTALVLVVAPAIFYMHEIWASLLIVLSLALYRMGLTWSAIVAAFLACTIRELAVPFLLAMGAFALLERRYREFAGWTGALVAFCALYAIHVSLTAHALTAQDTVSPGWVKFGGIPFAVETLRVNTALLFLPRWVAAICGALTLIGLAGARDPWLNRIGLVVGGYLVAFMIVGRPANYYWGMLIAPLVPVGLAFVLPALLELLRSAAKVLPARRRPGRSPHTR
jgi:hypothetical protein